ncbi:hypothetical protein Mth01_24090 [Sphaerimonospora thailandensis]|uniref:Uncharacterized protein n=1 Tax=Sphaerimonospora thailandensis TaxID=795644 RepID=A0A8J3VZS1_9ACTN|nr:hypothetical protein Mth01_24090 [Sphaerimonospora thailandensis]
MDRIPDHLKDLALPRGEAKRVTPANREVACVIRLGASVTHDATSQSVFPALLRVSALLRATVPRFKIIIKQLFDFWLNRRSWRSVTSYGSSIDIVFDFLDFPSSEHSFAKGRDVGRDKESVAVISGLASRVFRGLDDRAAWESARGAGRECRRGCRGGAAGVWSAGPGGLPRHAEVNRDFDSDVLANLRSRSGTPTVGPQHLVVTSV